MKRFLRTAGYIKTAAITSFLFFLAYTPVFGEYTGGLLQEAGVDWSFEDDDGSWEYTTTGLDYPWDTTTVDALVGDTVFSWGGNTLANTGRVATTTAPFSIDPEDTYTLGIYAFNSSTHWESARWRIGVGWFDESDEQIGNFSYSNDFSFSEQGEWELGEWTDVEPHEDAVKAKFRFQTWRDGGDSSRTSFDAAFFIKTEEEPEEASEVTLTGETDIRVDDDTATETYTATLDASIENVPVNFTLSDFIEADIDSVSEGTPADLVGAGIEVDTDENGVAELDITFAAGVDKSGDLTASIDEEHESVSDSASDNITLNVNTTEIPKYEITFDVQDEDTLSIERATVTLVGFGSELTGSNGLAVFTDVPEGTYDYTVEKEGFQTVEESIVADDDKTETVTLSRNLLLNWDFDGVWEGTASSGNPEHWGWGSRGERTTEPDEVLVGEASFAHEPYSSYNYLGQLGIEITDREYHLVIYAKGQGRVRPGIVHSEGTNYKTGALIEGADWNVFEHSYTSSGSTPNGGVDIGLQREAATGERMIIGAVWFGTEPPPEDWPVELPDAPSDFAGTAVSTATIHWSWQHSSTDTIDGFEVRSSTGGIYLSSSTLTADTTDYFQAGLTANTSSHYYKIYAVSEAGYSADFSSAPGYPVYTEARVPENLDTAQVNISSATLTWDINDNPPGTRFGISYSTDSNFKVNVSTPVDINDNLTANTTNVKD